MVARFDIQGLPAGGEALLDIWRVEPEPMVSYSDREGNVGDDEDQVIWSVSLPGDPVQASQILRERAGLIVEQRRRIGAAAQMLQQVTLVPDAGISFAIREGQAESPAEVNLRRNLAQLQGSEAEASYGWRDWLPQWNKTKADYSAFVQRMFHLLKPTMRVETKIQGEPLACSVVLLNGHLETAGRPGLTVAQGRLHQQTVALTLESRLALLQLLAKVGAGAGLLAVKLSLAWPVGPLLAMPAAWRYIQDVMQQVEALSSSG